MPSRTDNRTFADDDASLTDILQTHIDVSFLEHPLCVTLGDLVHNKEACIQFCHHLHGAAQTGNPPLCHFWGHASTQGDRKRVRHDKGTALTITLPLSLVWPLVRNATAAERGANTVTKFILDIPTRQGDVLREQSEKSTDTLRMSVFNLASGHRS